jgi:predicted ATPase
MHARRFRITNYRSILDSGDCYLSQDNITILAGKNESGKTAILEALEDFNTQKPIRDEAIPIEPSQDKPEITIWFDLDESTLDSILQSLNLTERLGKMGILSGLPLVKTYPAQYSIPLGSAEMILGGTSIGQDSVNRETIEKQINAAYEDVRQALSPLPNVVTMLPTIDLENSLSFADGIAQFQTRTKKMFAALPPKKASVATSTLHRLKDLVSELDLIQPLDQRLLQEILRRIPNFILFSSFDDIFPSEIPIQQAKQNPLIQDLADISELDLDLVTSMHSSAKQTHKKHLNVRLNRHYRKFWTQDLTNLRIDWDSGNLHFFIEEGDRYYQPKMRSKGKQWHLAFYVRVSARASADVANILLIDEPGLFLHAKAQQDILGLLEYSAKKTPVIFSTHSPYLIDTHALRRVRLVTRTTEAGTVISNKVHKNADKETLTPIITAIGLDLSLGLDIAKDNNLICEGITDYYYLSAFKTLLKYRFKNDVHFIPCAGADKCPLLAFLMVGWGLNYCILLDNDEKGREVRKKLSKELGNLYVRTVAVSLKENEEIEDLFAREDFAKYVLKEQSTALPQDQRNSEIIKQRDNNWDKVLLSKLFFEDVSKGLVPSLSSETEGSFKGLLQRVDQALFGNAQDASKSIDIRTTPSTEL